MNPEEEELHRLLASREPPELRNYLISPGDTPLIEGTGAPLISRGPEVLTSGGLVVPQSVLPSPTDYIWVYVTLDDYIPEQPPDRHVEPSHLAHGLVNYPYSRDELLVPLALLNRWVALSKERADELSEYYVRHLQPDLAERLRAALSGEDGKRRLLVARQPLLATMRHVIINGQDEPAKSPQVAMDVHAVMLSHAVASTLGGHHEDDEKTLAGFPASLAMEMLRIGLLYQPNDLYASMDRFMRLWLEYGGRESVGLRASPIDLLKECTGLDLEDILAMGFATLAYAMNWRPDEGKNPYMRAEFGTVETDRVERFLSLVSDDINGFQSRFKDHMGRFDFLPFQETPILRSGERLLVLDEAYLWDRITSGLYWLVHDHERDMHGDGARRLWTQAYGEMIERMAEDGIESMSPPLLGNGKSFYTEEDFKNVFAGKQPDAGIDFGASFLLFEVVSAQLSVPTRIDGDLEKFEADTERLVIKKCRQLHDLAIQLLEDDSKLTGKEKSKALKIYPVLVVGGGYPIHSFTAQYIDNILEEENLLQDARIHQLAIIDLGELEILEALAEAGSGVVDVIEGWKGSTLASVPLKNYVLQSLGKGPWRPERMKERVDSVFQLVIDRLGFETPPPEVADGT